MFRDTQEELQRLEAALQEQPEDTQPEQQEEPLLEEARLDDLLTQTDQTQSRQVYRNYSNAYGQDLRNYANGYRAYNTDTTDTDLERFSEAVQQPEKKGPGCAGGLILCLAGVVAVLLILLGLRAGGIL